MPDNNINGVLDTMYMNGVLDTLVKGKVLVTVTTGEYPFQMNMPGVLEVKHGLYTLSNSVAGACQFKTDNIIGIKNTHKGFYIELGVKTITTKHLLDCQDKIFQLYTNFIKALRRYTVATVDNIEHNVNKTQVSTAYLSPQQVRLEMPHPQRIPEFTQIVNGNRKGDLTPWIMHFWGHRNRYGSFSAHYLLSNKAVESIYKGVESDHGVYYKQYGGTVGTILYMEV